MSTPHKNAALSSARGSVPVRWQPRALAVSGVLLGDLLLVLPTASSLLLETLRANAGSGFPPLTSRFLLILTLAPLADVAVIFLGSEIGFVVSNAFCLQPTLHRNLDRPANHLLRSRACALGVRSHRAGLWRLERRRLCLVCCTRRCYQCYGGDPKDRIGYSGKEFEGCVGR